MLLGEGCSDAEEEGGGTGAKKKKKGRRGKVKKLPQGCEAIFWTIKECLDHRALGKQCLGYAPCNMRRCDMHMRTGRCGTTVGTKKKQFTLWDEDASSSVGPFCEGCKVFCTFFCKVRCAANDHTVQSEYFGPTKLAQDWLDMGKKLKSWSAPSLRADGRCQDRVPNPAFAPQGRRRRQAGPPVCDLRHATRRGEAGLCCLGCAGRQ